MGDACPLLAVGALVATQEPERLPHVVIGIGRVEVVRGRHAEVTAPDHPVALGPVQMIGRGSGVPMSEPVKSARAVERDSLLA